MFKRLGKLFGGLIATIILIVVATLATSEFLYLKKARQRTAAGTLRYTSQYLPMSDGTRLAIDIALPKVLKQGDKIPALIKGTPYWRASRLTFLGGALAELGLLGGLPTEPDVALLNDRGYAVITADTRGTGASFGHASIMFDDREVSDFGELIDWAAAQRWSNGRVGAYGFSYRGILAVDMASLDRPALKAIAPSFDFPDLYLTGYPGGVFSNHFIKDWSALTIALNKGHLPFGHLLIAGPKPVDADEDGALLARAIADHARNWNVYDCVSKATNRDDKICESGKSLSEISQISRRPAIEKSGIPMYVTTGYFDANSAVQALTRFHTFSNPQELTVGPFSHGGFLSTDPFADQHAPVDPSYPKQVSAMADFFDRYLKDGGKPISKSLHYFVLHGGGWKTADGWPPPGFNASNWYLGPNHLLSTTASAGDGTDIYKIDFTASTGTNSRYRSPVDLSKTSYPDRSAQDEKLLTYTSAPLDADIEIAGNPVANLMLATTARDGEVIVYLEDLSPDGTPTYLTEGILRLAHRKLSADARTTPSSDPLHTYLAADAAPMTPGKAELIKIGLFPIAVQLHKGERIRIAIAGADDGNLDRLPPTGDPVLTVERDSRAPSWIELPIVAAVK
jgi:putative CocE/NonD family hydrolase